MAVAKRVAARCSLLLVMGSLGAAHCTRATPASRLPPLLPASARAHARPLGPAALAGELALQAAQMSLEAGDYRGAQQQFLAVIEALPNNASARLGLAEAWLMLGTVNQDDELVGLAGQAAEQALVLAPDDDAVRYFTGLMRSRQHRPATKRPVPASGHRSTNAER